jgi:hypothetical protein
MSKDEEEDMMVIRNTYIVTHVGKKDICHLNDYIEGSHRKELGFVLMLRETLEEIMIVVEET